MPAKNRRLVSAHSRAPGAENRVRTRRRLYAGRPYPWFLNRLRFRIPTVSITAKQTFKPNTVISQEILAELEAAAEAAGTAPLDLAILENVGNLVCPAEFDTGASVNVAILSVPEGDDKPLKYPLMFEVCDVVLVNKMDVAPYFDFDLARCEENVRLRNPGAKVIPMSAKTGEGTDAWAAWLRAAVAAWKTGTFEKATPANSEAPHYPGE